LKLVDFKVSKIEGEGQHYSLKFEVGAITIANDFDLEFVNAEEIEIRYIEDASTVHLLCNKSYIQMSAKKKCYAFRQDLSTKLLGNIETFQRLVFTEVNEFKERNNSETDSIEQLIEYLEELNIQRVIDRALDERDFETVRKLVERCE
jgi:FtsZ-binding cell division protein ZapB